MSSLPSLLLTKLESACLCTVKPIYWHRVVMKASAAFIVKVPTQGWVTCALKPPNTQMDFSKAFLKAR